METPRVQCFRIICYEPIEGAATLLHISSHAKYVNKVGR
jgi:hypothetical protein